MNHPILIDRKTALHPTPDNFEMENSNFIALGKV
jgi:hypothetical protein